jgi:hypothetical protein
MTHHKLKLLPLFPLLLSYGLAVEPTKQPKLQKEFELSKQKEQSEFYGEPNGSIKNLYTTKTSCILQSDFKNKNQSELKQIVLTKAKAEAIDEIYGSFMNTKTELVNGKLINDEIKQLASGLVRIKGDAKYFNGENLGEICTTITAYATESDLKKYENVLTQIAENPKNDTPKENLFTENGILAYFYDQEDLALEKTLYQAVIKDNFNLKNVLFTNKILKSDKIYKIILSGFIKSDSDTTTTLKVDADVYDFSLFINDKLVTQANNEPFLVELQKGYNSLKIIARSNNSYDITINRVDMKKRKETPLQITELFYDRSKVTKY